MKFFIKVCFMFKVLKLKNIFIFLACLGSLVGIVSIGIVSVVNKENVPKPTYTIVVDAGHGGRDDGCSGDGGTKESEINLKIAKKLEKYLKALEIRVVMTREDGNGLYSADADNFKVSDMNKRIEIINKANADMVISIHQNSYVDKTTRGAQVFFQEDDENSKGFAESVQAQLIAQLPSARSEAIDGDYYLLKESGLPAVIVECGYLTNIEEELMLNNEDYQNKVAYAIMCGVVKYFNLCGND